MADDWAIDRSIAVRAPVEAVWGEVGTPERVSEWWCPPPIVTVEFDPAVGGAYTERYSEGEDAADVTGTIVTYDPPRHFAVERSLSGGRFGDTDTVEVSIEDDGSHSVVSLSHRFPAIAPDRRDEATAYYAPGWEESLERLRHLAESSRRG